MRSCIANTLPAIEVVYSSEGQLLLAQVGPRYAYRPNSEVVFNLPKIQSVFIKAVKHPPAAIL